jgi:uncharacterized membrane protein
MRVLRYPVALLAVLGLCVLTAWIMAWPFQRAIILAPVIVCGAAALVGLVLLWGKVAVAQVRESRNPRRLVAYWVIGLGLLVVLTVLGVKLPSEGH